MSDSIQQTDPIQSVVYYSTLVLAVYIQFKNVLYQAALETGLWLFYLSKKIFSQNDDEKRDMDEKKIILNELRDGISLSSNNM